MTPWPAHLQTHWYAVALAREVGARPLARRLLDRPIALLRFGDGALAAFEDRCPHRQAPLSQGCVRDGLLRCPYHGWGFDRDGRLRAMPGLPDGAALPEVSARTLAVREHGGLVWVCPRHDGARTLPRVALEPAPQERRFLWSTTLDAHVLDAVENALDANHTHFVHRGLVRRGDGPRHRTTAALRARPDGFVVDYRGDARQSGLIYRLFESERALERAHFVAPANVQFEYAYRNGANARISLHFAPESADITRLHAAFHIRGRTAPAWAVRLFVGPFLRRVATQDARMLALQARGRREFPGRQDAIGPLDVVRRHLQALYEDGASALPDRDVDLML